MTNLKIPQLTKKQVENLWDGITKRPSGCWEWHRCCFTAGYGMIRLGNHGYAVHRVVYQLHYGNDPSEMQVLHRCDNRKCCRPDHLFLGTNYDNVMDKMQKGRWNGGKGAGHGHNTKPECYPVGEDHRMSKATTDQVIEIRRRRATGEPCRQIATDFGFSKSMIESIAARKTWKHVT